MREGDPKDKSTRLSAHDVGGVERLAQRLELRERLSEDLGGREEGCDVSKEDARLGEVWYRSDVVADDPGGGERGWGHEGAFEVSGGRVMRVCRSGCHLKCPLKSPLKSPRSSGSAGR